MLTPVGGGPVAPDLNTGPGTLHLTKPAGGPAVTPAAKTEKAPTTSYDVDIYQPKAGDTYESISREFYSDTRYAEALRAYNRSRPLGQQTTVDVPPLHVVRKYTPGAGGRGEAAAPEWNSAAGTGRGTAARTYTVPAGGASLGAIARSLLGTEQRWRDIYDLNPQVTDPNRIPAGTELRLPADARNPG